MVRNVAKKKKKKTSKMEKASKKPFNIIGLIDGKEVIRIEISTCSPYESVKSAFEFLSHHS